MVRFGINLQLEEYSTCMHACLALKTAQLADELGIHAVFVNDHYMKPQGSNSPDAFLMLTAMALQTKHVLLGTAVTPIPFRSAPQTAKIVSTLDNISRGRFILGVGAGWNQAEFEGYGATFMPANERVSKTLEGVRLMKRLWTEEEVTFHGRYYHTKGTILLPKPLQRPHPPILIGSRSRRMRLAAAREGNGWIPGHLPIKDYENMMSEILKEAEKHGKHRDDLTFVHFTRILTGPHMDEVCRLLPKGQIERITERYVVGSSENCVEKLQEYVDIGVDLILLRLHQVAQTSFVREKKHLEQVSLIYNEIFSRLEES